MQTPNLESRQPTITNSRDRSWFFWFLLPLYPYGQRPTLRQEVIPGTIWTFDQPHGIFYTVVPIRMTIVRLEAGGLLVYAPIAPTQECLRLIQELVVKYGEVKYILLPTTSGLEHKVFVVPFARRFPNAQIFVTPHQWSFPFNLPLNWLGFPLDRTQILTDETITPFLDEFDHAVVDIDLGRGAFGEIALFHRRSRTLLVTDIVMSVPETPPAIVQLDPYPLLFHARDDAFEVVEDTPANRRKGWQRISLFAFYFSPSALEPAQLGQAVRDAFKAPDRSRKALFGFYPFRWQEGWEKSFAALRGNGRPFVAPVLQTLILPQGPRQVLDWADKIACWGFERIIPCHFDAPIATSPQQFRQAFTFLEKSPVLRSNCQNSDLPQQDFEFLNELEQGLIQRGIVSAPKEKV